MTQVLARKWRPRSFVELVGQEHVVKALGNALTQQRLHHAYLFTGTRGDYAYAEVIGLWNAEGRDFVNRPVPDYSRTGRWQDVSHYAQLVARATTHFGCAAASNARDDFVVCRYWPAGNVVGTWVY